jgi:hypothetical protein
VPSGVGLALKIGVEELERERERNGLEKLKNELELIYAIMGCKAVPRV